MNSYYKLVTLGVFSILCLGLGLYAQYKEGYPAPKVQLAAQNETTNWKTFRNDKVGFEFKYPPEYQIREQTGGRYTTNIIRVVEPGIYEYETGLDFWLDDKPDDPRFADLNYIYNYNLSQIGVLVRTEHGGDVPHIYSVQKINLGGIEAVKTEQDGDINQGRLYEVYFVRGGQPLRLYWEKDGTFGKIVETLKFTN